MLAVKPQSPIHPQREWKAKLDLVFSFKNEKTILSHRKHIGPLIVQRPFYPEGAVCHVYLIHPPGGVVGGDKLHIDVTLEADSHVLITTPSAGKFYRSGNLKGSQYQILRVAEQSLLEWFPQETIFFNDCKSELNTKIQLEKTAMFCGWEINCLGRPAAEEKYLQGHITQGLQLYRDNKPLFMERNEIEGSGEILNSPCGLNRNTVFATLLATNMDKVICDQLQTEWHEKTEKNISVTLINDVLVCRYLGGSAEQAKKYFCEIWSVIRMKQKKLKTCAPRIWST